jgi:D-glycero-alpha-D-manno-heptose-7-phosphate kinase
MIISRTPYRISFFGGGTDYPDWYLDNGGQVLSTTIDKYLYISCRYLPPFFEHRLRLVYSRIEECQHSSALDHPSAREVLKFLGIKGGLEIHYDGDLPGRSGLGSSSSFTVGLLNALYAYQGRKVAQHHLAMESIHIEQDLIKETVGSQDQVNAAYGGLNRIQFKQSGKIIVDPITVPKERLETLNGNLMLFYTGIMRTAEKVAKSYVEDLQAKKKQLVRMHAMVDEAIKILLEGHININDFGFLLNEAWQEKRSLSKMVSNPQIDEIYDTAISAGALGGKLSGAGGGGFLLLYVPIEKQPDIKQKLSRLLHVPFSFEPKGSQIIFYDRQKKYKKEEMAHAENIHSPFVELKDIK